MASIAYTMRKTKNDAGEVRISMDTLSLVPSFLKVNTNYKMGKIRYQNIYNNKQYFYIITSIELDAKDETGQNKTGQNGTGQDDAKLIKITMTTSGL